MSEKKVEIRVAKPSDAPTFLMMIRELAEFEKFPDGVKIDETILAKDLERDAVRGYLLYEDDEPAAMLLWHFSYSTWTGQFIHMEDIYVRPQFRRNGYARKLWVELGKEAHRLNVSRLQLNVLDWNENAIKFYKTMPIQDLTSSEGWLTFRLDREGIKTLATSLDN